MVMRTFIFLLCTIVFGFNAENSYAQKKVTINEDKIMSIDDVFEIIMNQTKYLFLYPENLFEKLPKVQLKKGKITVDKLLNKSIPKNNFNVILSGSNTILIKQKSTNQQRQVSGTVTDEAGIPVSDVTVLIKGTTDGVSTNFDGNYSINVSNPKDVLVFSAIGFLTQEIIIESKNIINVTLKERTNLLDEVVVTGYQKLSINKSTGSTASVKAEVISKKGNSNILQSLEGQIAGLSIVPDPRQEGSTNFDIRGITSLQGDSRPLIVVDGIPIEGDISTINPYEVESVSVLKDAASSSIYGARSANGVIVITTKKGKPGKLKVSYRSIMTTTNKPDLAYRLNRVGSADLVDIQKTAIESAYANNVHSYKWWRDNDPDLGYYYIAAPNLVYETFALEKDGYITQEEANARYTSLKTKDNTKQFEKYFLQSPFEQQHNASISGGGDKNTFRTSLNYTDNKFKRIGSESNRIIFDALDNYKINDKIDIDIIANIVLKKSKETPVPDNLIYDGGVNSYEDIIDNDGGVLAVRVANPDPNRYDILAAYGGKDPLEIQRLIKLGLLDENYYPLKELGATTIDNTRTSVRLQGMFNAKLSSSLRGHFTFQYESGNSKRQRIVSRDSWEMTSLINNTTPLSFTGDVNELNIPYGARLTETISNRKSYTLRGQLDFDKTFGDHEVSSIIGSEIRNVFSTYTTTNKFGYDKNTLLFRTLDRKSLEKGIDDVYDPEGYITGLYFNDDLGETTNRYFSLYGNFTYGYKSRYIISGSARIDQSNLFGTDPKYRYKPFWSVGGKWRVSEEDFFNSSWVNKLDLRVTYGINGNISNKYGPFNIVSSLNSYPVGGIPSLTIITPAIADLRWEKTITSNLGLDVNMFNQRVNLSLDYYIKNTGDLLANVETNPTLGYTSAVKNDADISNRGIEISLRTRNIQNENFSWFTFITFRHNKNKVKKVYNNDDINSNSGYYTAGLVNVEGAPANSFWYFNYNKLDENGNATIKKANGDIIVLDGTRYPGDLFKLEDLVKAGTINPIYSGSITNTFNYKNLLLSFMFIGNGGHVLLNDSYNGRLIDYRVPTNINSDIARAWKKSGDENTTDIPKIHTSEYYSEDEEYITRTSTKNIIDGDYLKLREVILTYSLPKKILNPIKINHMQFNLRANNLFYIAKNKKGIDPESHGMGERYFPVKQSYSLGITINF